MFDIGFQELIIIFLVALLVFGPKRLPEISRTLGKWVADARRGIHNAKVQMHSEFEEIEKKAEEQSGAARQMNTKIEDKDIGSGIQEDREGRG